MGFNVQGIAISKKYADAQELANELGIGNIRKVGEAYFENASSYSIADEDIYITELPGGTLITLGTGFDIDDFKLSGVSEGGAAMRFLVGETAMVFAFEYYENGQSRRSVMHFDGENRMEEGAPLPSEALTTDLTGVIFGLIGAVTGTDFYSIEPGQLSVQYQVQQADSKVQPESEA